MAIPSRPRDARPTRHEIPDLVVPVDPGALGWAADLLDIAIAALPCTPVTRLMDEISGQLWAAAGTRQAEALIDVGQLALTWWCLQAAGHQLAGDADLAPEWHADADLCTSRLRFRFAAGR